LPKNIKVKEEKFDHTNLSTGLKISNEQKSLVKSNITALETDNALNMNHQLESSNTKNDFIIPKNLNEDSNQAKT